MRATPPALPSATAPLVAASPTKLHRFLRRGWLGALPMLAFLATALIAACSLVPGDSLMPGLLGIRGWLLESGNMTVFSMVHTGAVGFLGFLAFLPGHLSRERAGELTKITGYLYTLIGLLLVFKVMELPSIEGDSVNTLARVMPGVGTAILSSVVGWIVGTAIEGDSYHRASKGMVDPGLPPQVGSGALPKQLLQTLEDFGAAVTRASRHGATTAKQLESLGIQVATFQAYLEDTAKITRSVRELLEREGPWREHQENQLERACTLLQEILTRLPRP